MDNDKCVSFYYWYIYAAAVSCFIYLLWPPYGMGQAIIFLPCGFYLLLSFFFSSPNLSAPYFHTWCGLIANLECMSEMCCTRLVENTGCKKVAILAPSHSFVGLYLQN